MPVGESLKLAPYGEADFQTVRNGRYSYVDKTRFIEVLENLSSRFPFIVRPRRFGKTLFTETLAVYYDKAAAGDFEKNFAGTYIGAHRTAMANQFYVVKLDFSGISPENVTLDFIARVRRGFISFCQRYEFDDGFAVLDREYASATALWSDFMGAFIRQFVGGKIYLIIDEYDQFANEMLSEDAEQFKKMTTKGGLLKAFYAGIKAEATQGAVGRVFITGVTSISLDSMTSGFNITSNYTCDPAIAEMFGFTESELRGLIPRLLDLPKYGKSEEEVFAHMKAWYNGYCFNSDAGKTVFNASMCLYYLDFVQRNNREPDDMADPAFSQDLTKIEGIFRLGNEDFIRRTLVRALQGEVVDFPSGSLQVLNLNDHQALDEDGILSAMVYLGYLTFVPGNRFALRIPNRAVGIQFFEYYLKRILGAERWRYAARTQQQLYAALAAGNPRPLFETVSERFGRRTGTHAGWHLRESDFQTLLLSTLLFSDAFEVQSEVEVRGKSSGYIDLLIEPRPGTGGKAAYLVEIKYLTKKDGSKEVAVANKLAEARKQAMIYAQGDNIRTIPNLVCVCAVFVGTQLAAFETVPAV